MKIAQISGIGVVSCLGMGLEALWHGVLESRSGIGSDGFGQVNEISGSDRALEFCRISIHEALNQAGWQRGDVDGLILATTTGQFLQWHQPFIDFAEGLSSLASFRQAFCHQPLGALSQILREEFEIQGPASVVTSACTASTQALGLSTLWLRSGRARRLLVGGVEVLCPLTCEGFRSLQLLSPQPCRPFDRDRRGINLSEGAAFFCVEMESENPLARIEGAGYSTDSFHMTSPEPRGKGSARAIRQALQKAAVAVDDIDWIHAHGTGSLHNDAAESSALAEVFGPSLPVSSTKWLHGHALAASGAIETALVIKSMLEGKVIATRGLENPDSTFSICLPRRDEDRPIRRVLKNTLGFGGANAALVIGRGGPV
ncbi:MAG: beta-ketoacyl-[acyl-carrier-protein] synthase family protein [Bdellovibrionales bacterium]